MPEAMPESDARLLRAFRQRYDRLVAASARLPLEVLCEHVLVAHDYDLAVLGREDGARRYANLRKLARLARSYEELRGADLEGFIRFVSDQEAAGAREADAVAEEEGADAVRLLTIHAAKGLEFKVVVVADAGRDRVSDDEILCLSDGRFGFKVAHPQTGSRVVTPSYDDVRESRNRADEAERLRLYYVGMTRAMERLIVSGSVDVDKVDTERTPIAWALTRLGAADTLNGLDGPLEIQRGAASVLLSVDRWDPTDDQAVVAEAVDLAASEMPAGGQLELFSGTGEALPQRAPRLRDLPVVPQPAQLRVSRLSFSAVAQYDTCSLRYWAERVAGIRPRAVPTGDAGDGGLRGTEIGDAVHRRLELVDLSAPTPPAALSELLGAWYPAAMPAEHDRIAGLVAAYCSSELAARIAALPGTRVEVGFAFEHDEVLFNGRLDVHWSAGSRSLVLDYKTNALGDQTPEEIVADGYTLQRLVYALACLRAGTEEVEVVYQFLERPDEPVSATFRTADIVDLEADLSTAIARVRAADFRPSPSEYACADCPALDVVCAGPRLRFAAPPPLELATAS
jgi:ATP-dependent exoDNAse (exonuclease V) beta subunit